MKKFSRFSAHGTRMIAAALLGFTGQLAVAQPPRPAPAPAPRPAPAPAPVPAPRPAPVPVPAPEECVLPICEMAEAVSDFRAMRVSRRASFLEQFVTDFAENTEAPVAKNLIDFIGAVQSVYATDPTQETVKTQANNLLDQSHGQLARFAPISQNVLLSSFRLVQSQRTRYRVISHWGVKLPEMQNIAEVRKLREFFALAQQLSTAANDEPYVSREALRWERASYTRIIELSPNAPVVTVPIRDQNAAINQFRSLDIPERYLLVHALVTRFAESRDADALATLVDFSTRAQEVLRGSEDAQAFIIAEARTLYAQSVNLIVRNDTPTVEVLINYYRLLAGPSARYQALAYWGVRVEEIVDVNFLQKLVNFFRAAADASIQLADDEYVSRDALRLEGKANARIIDLGNAPSIALPIVDMPRAVAGFTGLPLAQRFLLVKKLTDDNAASTNSPALRSLVEYAQQIKPVAVAAGVAQASIVTQIDLLFKQTVELLVRANDLRPEELVNYYKLLDGPRSRLLSIQHWGARLVDINDRAGLNRVIAFFSQARRASNVMEDEDYVIREAQRFEGAARSKLRELPATPALAE